MARAHTAAYEIDTFDPADRPAFCSLYEEVFGMGRSTAWFRWKFQENPAADHVSIVVARDGNDLIGCRSLLPMTVVVDGELRLAYQPCDTMVHPDHRRRGVFSRMNEAAVERYAHGEPAFFFNFPNAQSKPGNVEQGWHEVGTVPMYYRPQNAVAASRQLAAARRGPAATDWKPSIVEGGTWPAISPVGDVQRAIDELLVERTMTVRRYVTPADAPLESVYRRAVPDGIHAVRNEAFYDWRFDSPLYEYEAYVGFRNGEPTAAVVVSPVGGCLRLIDVLPRDVDAERDGVEALLVRAFDDHGSTDEIGYVAAFGDVLPRPLRLRFYPDTRFPLSTLADPTSRSLLVRRLGELSIEDRPIDDWTLSWFDLDAV